MPEREKVIKGLECCLIFDEDRIYQCDECPYRATEDERKVIDWCCHLEKLRSDALELLKGQEPVKPRKILPCITRPVGWYVCGHCGIRFLEKNDYYCPNCGRAVKWDKTV